MNIETANRLLNYRKNSGLSQEELAERIGVSRQAVSKWERSEASPDTDNLIALARLYGVTLDELINGKSEPSGETADEKQESETEKGEGDNINVKVDLTIEKKSKKKATKKKAIRIVEAATPIACTIAFLILGCVYGAWKWCWIVYFLVPIVPSLVSAIVRKKPTDFCYPVLVAGLYLIAGICYGRWHPEWVLFLTIPLYYIITEPIEKAIKKKQGD